MTLAFHARLAARGFDAEFHVGAGETVAVLGANGAGKSTLLNLIAGLLRPDSGHAELDGRRLFELGAAYDAQAVHRYLPPHRRGVAMLGQEPMLFPHLSVLDNVAFGPRSAGVGAAEARESARRWLAEVEASQLADVRAAELSGGQAQRVAVARALAAEPSLLLLDEPLSALDVSVAAEVRRMLRRVLPGRSTVIVTHDLLDAYMLAERVVVMADGHIVEQGVTAEVFTRPQTGFTAELAGVNLIAGLSTEGGLVSDRGFTVVGARTDLGEGEVPNSARIRMLAAVSPAAVHAVTVERLGESVLWRGRPGAIEPHGDVVRVHGGGLVTDVSPAEAAALDPEAELILCAAPEDIVIYPVR